MNDTPDVVIGGIYEHYKGNRYTVIGIGLHSDTHERMVVYRGLYHSEEFGDQPLWVRPLAVFTEMVAIDGVRRPRFERVHQ